MPDHRKAANTGRQEPDHPIPMLQLNLFYEQQRIQREKDLDPVRLTIVGTCLILLIIGVWGLLLYMNMRPVLTEVASNAAEAEKLKKQLTAMGTLTDLPKIQNQARKLFDHTAHRILTANQLDHLRYTIPTNCQVMVFKFSRKPGQTEEKKPILHRELTLEVHTKAPEKVQVLQIRDLVYEGLRKETRFQEWVRQIPDVTGATTNMENEALLTSSITKDPKDHIPALGIFEFKMIYPPILGEIPEPAK
jgi:hypothetical protein